MVFGACLAILDMVKEELMEGGFDEMMVVIASLGQPMT